MKFKINQLSLSDMQSGYYYQPGRFWPYEILQAAGNSGEKTEKIFYLAILNEKEMIENIPGFGSRQQCMQYALSMREK